MRVLVAVFCFNEGEKIKRVLAEFPADRGYDIVVMNDGSTDDSKEYIVAAGVPMLEHTTNLGAGAAIKTVFRYALDKQYDVIVLIAGNGKMRPAEIPQLIEPILANQFDYVQGSRYISEGRSANMPLFRRLMIPLFTFIVRLVTGFPGTDVTCGFRAYRLDILGHPKVNVWQSWLDKYEMEYYVHYKAIHLGFRVCERPVSMIYPEASKNYSKIRPFTGWWSMIRPWIYLLLRLKK